jgi:hypothetical protein
MPSRELRRVLSYRRARALCERCGRPLRVVALEGDSLRMACPPCDYARTLTRGTATFRQVLDGLRTLPGAPGGSDAHM